MNFNFAVRLCSIVLAATAFSAAAAAQGNSYRQAALVSDVPALAPNFDPALSNPWGIAFAPGQPFRIAVNHGGSFQSYDATGVRQIFSGVVAPPSAGTPPSRPTGVVANSTALFIPLCSLSSPFLFATEDGTVSGEYADSRGDILATTLLVIDHSAQAAVYTGLAILTPTCCAPFLAVANFHNGVIETYTGAFAPLATPGTFTDPNLPAGYAPYNLQVIGTQLFVTYALQDQAGLKPVFGTNNGIVDIFDLEGNFVKRFVSNTSLNAPWGVAQASANFGVFSNDILVGNSGDGTISAFDPLTGEFMGQLRDTNGNTILDSGLHGMVFGSGGGNDADTLFITESLDTGNQGVFAAITAAPPATAADFSVSATPMSTTVTAAQSATFMLTATPTANFAGVVSFTCMAPAGITCGFNPASVNTANGAANTTLTAATSTTATYSPMTGMLAPGFILGGLGVLGAGLARRRKAGGSRGGVSRWLFAVAALALSLGACAGCGGYGNKNYVAPNHGTASIMVTAQAGTVSHTTTLTLTVQ